MRFLYYILPLSIIACNNQKQKVNNSDSLSSKQIIVTGDPKNSNKDICWAGTLNDKTPIFIHYQFDNNLIVGEIIYLNTKNKLPIRLVGTVEGDKSYRLLEFDKTGNITGIIEGTPTDKEFKGSWGSPKTKRELEMNLVQKDTLINSPSIKPEAGEIFGDYHYQYGESGYRGDFEINQISDNKASFSILSLTNAESGPNIAEVEKDTLAFSGDNFIYKIPESNNCEFKVTFYKGFIYVNYTKGYCEGQFGLNATIDGIYLKTD